MIWLADFFLIRRVQRGKIRAIHYRWDWPRPNLLDGTNVKLPRRINITTACLQLQISFVRLLLHGDYCFQTALF